MLQGKQCAECSVCYRDEATGNSSFRIHSNEQFSKYIPQALETNPDGSLKDFKLRYLDIRWSNICNFSCRSCSSTYSSSWAKEDGKKNVYIFAGGNSNDELYNQFEPHFDTIEEFYFAGGEPLLTDKHYDILEYLIEHNKTDVKLRYNSNLSVLRYKDKNILELWNKFNNVYVGASLDSWGKRAEYIRHGTKWNLIEDNINRIRKETPHVNLQTNTVVSIFNIYTLPEFINYLIDNNLVDINNYKPHFYNIQNPDFYSFNILTNDFKEKTLTKLKEFMNNSSDNIKYAVQGVINGLESSKYTPELKSELVIKTEYYDMLRNENVLETFPEITELF